MATSAQKIRDVEKSAIKNSKVMAEKAKGTEYESEVQQHGISPGNTVLNSQHDAQGTHRHTQVDTHNQPFSIGLTKTGEEALFVKRTDLVCSGGGLSTTPKLQTSCQSKISTPSHAASEKTNIKSSNNISVNIGEMALGTAQQQTHAQSQQQHNQQCTQEHYTKNWMNHQTFNPNDQIPTMNMLQYPPPPLGNVFHPQSYPSTQQNNSRGVSPNAVQYPMYGNNVWPQSGYKFFPPQNLDRHPQDSDSQMFYQPPNMYVGANMQLFDPRKTATAVTPSGHTFAIPLDDQMYELKDTCHDQGGSPKDCDLHKLETEVPNKLTCSPRPVQYRNSDDESDDVVSYGDSATESQLTDASETDEAIDTDVFSDEEEEQRRKPAASPSISIVEEMFRNAIRGQTCDTLKDEKSNHTDNLVLDNSEQCIEDGTEDETNEDDIAAIDDFAKSESHHTLVGHDHELIENTDHVDTLVQQSIDGSNSEQTNAVHADFEDQSQLKTTETESVAEDVIELGAEITVMTSSVPEHANAELQAVDALEASSEEINPTMDQGGQYSGQYGEIVSQGECDFLNQCQFQMPPVDTLYQQWSSQNLYMDQGATYGTVPGQGSSQGPAVQYDDGHGVAITDQPIYSNIMDGINPELIDPDSGLAFPALHVAEEGVITVLLRKGICLEMTVERALRLVHHEKKLVVAMNDAGTSACVIHPAMKLIQTDQAIDVELFQERKAHITSDAIFFGNDRRTYRFDNRIATEVHTTPSYRDLSGDWSVTYLDATNAFCNWDTMMMCRDITSKAYFEKSHDKGCKVIINGVKIIQNDKGETSVFCGPIKFLRISPDMQVVRVKTHFFEADVEANWNVKIHKGSVSVNASSLGFVLSNGRIKACLDSDNTFQAFDLPSYKRLNLGQPVQQRRPGVVPRKKYISFDNNYGRETDHQGYQIQDID